MRTHWWPSGAKEREGLDTDAATGVNSSETLPQGVLSGEMVQE